MESSYPNASDPHPPAIPDHELIRRIGQGGYGDVWLARTVLGTYRAVKIVYRSRFHEERPYDREFRGIRRFEPVSRTHPSQVAIYHVGRTSGGDYFYYVMDLADDVDRGQDIDPATYVPKTLSGEIGRQGSLSFENCLATTLGLTEALGALHDAGLLHRDIKPSNIIYVANAPKLADIGLVTGTEQTVSIVGTPGFMAPEGSGSQQADIYSLGKVLYEMANGRDRNDFPALPRDLAERPDRLQILELNELVLKACDRDPQKRYPSVAKFREDLLALSAGKSLKRSAALRKRIYWSLRFAAIVLVLVSLVTICLKIRSSLTTHALSESLSLRIAGSPGQRLNGLETLRANARWYLDVPESLRAAAVASLSVPDFTPLDEPLLSATEYRAVVFDEGSSHYAHTDNTGRITLEKYGEEQPVAVFDSQEADIVRLMLGPDASMIGALTGSNTFQAWRRGAAEPVFDDPLSCTVAAFNRTGTRLATMGTDRVLRLYEMPTGRRLKAKYVDRVLDSPDLLCWSADDEMVAIGRTGYMDLWVMNVVSLDDPIDLPSAVGSGVVSMAWHPVRSELSIGCANGVVYRWQPEVGRLQERWAHGNGDVHVSYLEPSGSPLTHGSAAPHQFRVWDVVEGKHNILEASVPEHAVSVKPFAKDRLIALFSDAPPRVIGRFHDVTHLATRRDPRALHVPVERLSYSHDGHWLASGSEGGVTVWPASATGPRRHASTHRPNRAVQFHPGAGELLICNPLGTHVLPMNPAMQLDMPGSHLGPAKTYEPDFDRNLDFEIDPGLELDANQLKNLPSNPEPIDAAIALDGSIAVLEAAGIKVGRVGGPLVTIPYEGADELAFSRDGEWVAVSDLIRRRVVVWKVMDVDRSYTLPAPQGIAFDFVPGRPSMLVGERDRFSWWRFEEDAAKVTKTLARRESGADAFMSFSGNGELVALAMSDSEIVIRDLVADTTVFRVTGPADFPMTSLALSPSGHLLSAGFAQGYIRTWDVAGLVEELSDLRFPIAEQNAASAGPVPYPKMTLTPGHMENLMRYYFGGLRFHQRENPDMIEVLVWYHTKVGQTEEAEGLVQQASSRDGLEPSEVAKYWRIIGEQRLVHAKGIEGLHLAESAFLKSIDLRDESPDAWDQLGRVRVAQENYAEALPCFERSLKMREPTEAEMYGTAIYFHIAQCHAKLESRDKAASYYQMALVAMERSRRGANRNRLYDHAQKDLWRLLWITKSMIESMP